MRLKADLDEAQARAITSLVDRSLSAEDEMLAVAWFGGQPESWLGLLRREVESQRRVARALRTAGPRVPETLIRAVQARLGSGDGRR